MPSGPMSMLARTVSSNIRELRTALGDDQRELIKLVSGRGYLFTLEVVIEPAEPDLASADEIPHGGTAPERVALARTLFGISRRTGLVAICLVIGLAVAVFALRPGVALMRATPSIAVMPIVATDAGQAIAVGVTDRLVDGIARIDNVRVVTLLAAEAREPAGRSDFELRGELRRDAQSWILTARVVEIASGEVRAVATVSVDVAGSDAQLQQSRLAAGVARQLNALLESGADPIGGSGAAPGSGAKVVIQQAMASINQTSRERFAAAQAMLETSLAAAPENIDLQVALAGLQTRGIQMLWYSAEASVARGYRDSASGRALMVDVAVAVAVMSAYLAPRLADEP